MTNCLDRHKLMENILSYLLKDRHWEILSHLPNCHKLLTFQLKTKHLEKQIPGSCFSVLSYCYWFIRARFISFLNLSYYYFCWYRPGTNQHGKYIFASQPYHIFYTLAHETRSHHVDTWSPYLQTESSVLVLYTWL